jgi:3-oxoacyl-[acyl-carrier-protein] synthase II
LTRRLDRSAALFVAAANEAWADAGLEKEPPDLLRAALVEGSSLGPLADILETATRAFGEGSAPVHPTFLVRHMTGSGGVAFAQAHRLQGDVIHLSSGSVSALHAIGEGYERIRKGRADIVVAGGGEAPLSPVIAAQFQAAGILSDEPDSERPCRPFDPTRNGTVLGEGAAVFVLESAASARARGARPRARIGGFGSASESFSPVAPDPDGKGVCLAVGSALGNGHRHPPGWIKAHATATPVGDAAECQGLARVFGAELTGMPLTGLKPTLGHCLGASGAVEAAATILALEGGFVPATLGTREVDPHLPPCAVATRVRESSARSALVLAESFGGRCAALLLEIV